jgi:hypothetical protein
VVCSNFDWLDHGKIIDSFPVGILPIKQNKRRETKQNKTKLIAIIVLVCAFVNTESTFHAWHLGRVSLHQSIAKTKPTTAMLVTLDEKQRNGGFGQTRQETEHS